MFLLDTCTVSDFLKHIDSTLNQKMLSHPPQRFFISALMIDEIEYGLSRHTEKAKKYRPLIEEFLQNIGTENILPLDFSIAQTAGKLRASLQAKGLVIEQYDLLIGITAFTHRMTLITSNTKHFSKIPGLSLENWRKP